LARAIVGDQDYFSRIPDKAVDRIERKLQTLMGPSFVAKLPSLNWRRAQDMLAAHTNAIISYKRVIYALLAARESLASIPEQARHISTRVRVIKIDLSKMLKQRSACCATQSPCCSQKLVHPCGKSYKSLISKLAQRTRNLLRQVEQRKLERGRHARTRRMLRNLAKRIYQMNGSL
jgi:hypothetical protein